MSHVPRTVPEGSTVPPPEPCSEESATTAWVGILDKTGQPALFVPEARPGDPICFGTASSTESAEVRFEHRSPLVDDRTRFTVLPGPAVPLRIRDDAVGEFPFVLRDPANPLNSTLLILDVSPSGPSTRLQFIAGANPGAFSQAFVRGTSRRVDLVIENRLDHKVKVEIGGPAQTPPLTREIEAKKTHVEPVFAPAFGKILHVMLKSPNFKSLQSGGTEQVDIILEPD